MRNYYSRSRWVLIYNSAISELRIIYTYIISNFHNCSKWESVCTFFLSWHTKASRQYNLRVLPMMEWSTPSRSTQSLIKWCWLSRNSIKPSNKTSSLRPYLRMRRRKRRTRRLLLRLLKLLQALPRKLRRKLIKLLPKKKRLLIAVTLMMTTMS